MTNPNRLFNRNFFLLWQGQFVSQLGNQAFAIAMLFWIKHQTGSASLVGLIMMATQIPGVLLGPIAGTFADHHSRKKIIVTCDLINGIAVISLAALMFLLPDNTDLLLGYLFAISIIAAAVGSFFRPAISASIPDMVPKEKLTAANSLNQFSVQISGFVGQGAGGVLYRVLGAPLLFLLDGVSYLASAFSEMFITIPQKIVELPTDRKELFRRFKKDTADGFRYAWSNSGLRSLFFVAAFLNFFLVPIFVLMPFFVEDFMHVTTDWYGYIMAAFSVGSMGGFTVAGTIKLRGQTRSIVMIAALVLMSAGMAVLYTVPTAYWMIALNLFVGVMNGFVNINIATIMQLTTPSEMRGRVFGLLGTLATGLMPISMGLSGVIADLVDQNIPLIFLFCGSIAALLSIGVGFSGEFRKFLAYEGDQESDLVSNADQPETE